MKMGFYPITQMMKNLPLERQLEFLYYYEEELVKRYKISLEDLESIILGKTLDITRDILVIL